MMRRPFVFTAFLALLVGLLLGGFAASAATPNDTACRKAAVSGSPSTAELLAYDACRFDRLDASVAALGPASTPTPSASTAPTVRPSATPTPSVTPKPSATPTTASPTPSASSPTAAPASTDYPNASTTGVPAGTTLRKVPGDLTSGAGWTWKGGGEECIHVETDGAVLDGLDVSGCIEVYANDVTISKTRITAAGEGWGVGVRGHSGVKITDVDISGNGQRLLVGVKDVTGGSEITILRADIADYSSGVQMSRGLLQDSYIHDPKFVSGDHTNGFTHNGGRSDGTMTVRHNTILNAFDQADAISFFEDFGVVKNVVADNNLIAGGSYSLYAGKGDKGTTSNVTITNNRFSTRYLPNGGAFGPVCCYDHVANNSWSGNVWADGPKAGQTIPAP